MTNQVGITTTVPVEVLLAAGCAPVDLNNVFITDPDPGHLVTEAERAGFPLTCCTWIKGLFGTVLERGIKRVLGVTAGDCSNTLMLLDVLKLYDVEVIPFAFPPRPEVGAVTESLASLAQILGTTVDEAEKVRLALAEPRRLAERLDELTWRENKASGWENHLWLVSSSDFNGDPKQYAKDVRAVVDECETRQPYPADELRLAYLGVPPLFASDLYRFVESQGARVVFNEVQRQFAMLGRVDSLAEQYARYTYPYSTYDRLPDITTEIERRRVDGVVHYVQAFCHEEISDIVLRKHLSPPVLTIQGNTEYALDGGLRTRIEAFLDVIRRHRAASTHRQSP
jgi:benzoyl-CoA reductase/2-hydroxyglutaryl-CoA dehydratase subunit BcrC/BadD/HgdB